MSVLSVLISSFLGTAAALGAVGYLAKSFIQNRLNRDLAAFNLELQKDLTKMSAELANLAKQQEIKFSSLHAQRAQIIAELYERMNKAKLAYGKLSSYPGAVPLNAEQKEKKKEFSSNAVALFHALKEFGDSKRIYFPPELHVKLNELCTKMLNGNWASNQSEESFKTISLEVEDVLKSIEEDFRKLLGVEERQ